MSHGSLTGVTDILDLPVELRAVGERGQRYTGNQGGQLHSHAHPGQLRGDTHEETPRQGEHQPQLQGDPSPYISGCLGDGHVLVAG